jgi:hypothetical protein
MKVQGILMVNSIHRATGGDVSVGGTRDTYVGMVDSHKARAKDDDRGDECLVSQEVKVLLKLGFDFRDPVRVGQQLRVTIDDEV